MVTSFNKNKELKIHKSTRDILLGLAMEGSPLEST